ncbi:MAG TPA: hypothetical protein QGG47_10755 [Acidobacteriota bacterium]|nr:hypothetical protein [Acidobacteriota bacterium]
MNEANNQIRRDKFDLVLPRAMRDNSVDMWIHVMREAIPDSFGAEELGSPSGVFVFTDRGGDRIERAILGRRWGASHRDWGDPSDYEDPIEVLGAYDIIGDPVLVRQPVGGPMTEYDYRFKGLRAFVAARDPQRIAVNFKRDLAQWATYRGHDDGISHTDYTLLAEELGERYAERLVSSEYVLMDYITQKVPREVELLKRMREDEIERVHRAFDEVEPGVTRTTEFGRELYYAGATVLRRMSAGLSQRGRSAGWENSVIQGGDILAAEGVGMYAYVLRDGEVEPPPEVQRLWAEYLKIDEILSETIRSGRTPRQIAKDYTRMFEEEGIIVRDDQLHMVIPKNNFPVYSAGFDPSKTHLTIDAHGEMKGARERVAETYFAPRIGSYGPEWSKTIPLAPNHHFVLEYFFYMPSPAGEGEDQYLLWWDHEGAIVTEDGVEYLFAPQEELYLIH